MRFDRLTVVALMMTVCIGACDLLRPRDPQPPETGNTGNPPAFTPETVISNLQSSFATRNVNDYEKLFADTSSVGRRYLFVPTQKAAATFSVLFSHWTVDAELNYFRKAMNSVGSTFVPVVTITPSPTITQFHSDSALAELNYSVFLPPGTYVGHARFYLLPNKNTGTWVIYRWEDLQSSSDTSWSYMKGQFSQ